MDDKPRQLLIPIPEVRERLGGIGHTTVYELIKRGRLTKVNIGRRGFVTADSLMAFVSSLSEAKPAC